MAPEHRSFAPHLTRRRLLATGVATVGAALVPAAGTPAAAAGKRRPTVLRLPNGFRPEGIAVGGGPYAYLGSLGDGSLYRADLRTGEGAIFSAGPGTPSVGLKLDNRGRLFVAGRGQGARVVDARTGAILASYALTSATPTFANDVFLTPRTAWFTDSFQPALYALPLGRHGQLPDADEVVTLSLSGDWGQVAGEVVNANGITGTPDGSALLVVQSGVGLLLIGRTLYVVQNRQNAIDVFRLAADGHSGVFQRRVTDPLFDVPTTVAAYKGRLYLPNARFTTTPTPDTTYDVISVPA